VLQTGLDECSECAQCFNRNERLRAGRKSHYRRFDFGRRPERARWYRQHMLHVRDCGDVDRERSVTLRIRRCRHPLGYLALDVAVLGAGITGLLVAYALQRAGASVPEPRR